MPKHGRQTTKPVINNEDLQRQLQLLTEQVQRLANIDKNTPSNTVPPQPPAKYTTTVPPPPPAKPLSPKTTANLFLRNRQTYKQLNNIQNIPPTTQPRNDNRRQRNLPTIGLPARQNHKKNKRRKTVNKPQQVKTNNQTEVTQEENEWKDIQYNDDYDIQYDDHNNYNQYDE